MDTKLLPVAVLVVVGAVLCSARLQTYNKDVTCVAKPNQDPVALGNAIAYACAHIKGGCGAINPGGSHFEPNTIEAHASWAFGTYYNQSTDKAKKQVYTCDFGGTAMLTCPDVKPNGLMREKIHGVNIGGFLVLEPYITPNLFEQFVGKPDDQTAIDEYTFCKVLGQTEATKQLTAHWNSWVTEADIKRIAALGLTHIRVPFGYWIFGDVPPFVRGIEQLDRILNLAETYGLKVLLDLHGAIGSQNGFDNSGRACDIINPNKTCVIPCPKHPLWGTDDDLESINSTLKTIKRVVSRYKNHSAVWGFELVNEPRLINHTILKDFYTRGYEVVRSIAPKSWKVVIHDGFYPLYWWDFMTPAQGYENVILDTHIYEAFGSNVNYTTDIHLAEACGYTGNINFMQCNELPLIVGEWSLASTDCQLWLNGFGEPALSKYCDQRPPHTPFNTTFLNEYAIRQISAFSRSEGFFFWNFKTYNATMWSLFDTVDLGFMPSNFTALNGDIAMLNRCNFSDIPQN